MKSFAMWCCFFLLHVVALAVENGQVLYVSGTAASIKEGTIGRPETTSKTELGFNFGAEPLSIPFLKIEFCEYSQDVARHLGVLPAIGAGLLRKR
jgi:hypothetical protein